MNLKTTLHYVTAFSLGSLWTIAMYEGGWYWLAFIIWLLLGPFIEANVEELMSHVERWREHREADRSIQS